MSSLLGGRSLSEPKWQMPGWRIEQKYSTGVLIGNWSEDRLGKFQRSSSFGNSTHREDFQRYLPQSYQPDVTTRRRGLLMNDGLGKDQIFTHHGRRYYHNNISLYDQQFNRRHSMGTRSWDRRRLAWLPETSDHPMQGNSTNFGLKEALEEKWKKLQEMESQIDFTTSYSVTYRPPPPPSDKESPCKRYATARDLSIRLHPHSVNKNLHLRGKPLIIKPEVFNPELLPKKLSATV